MGGAGLALVPADPVLWKFWHGPTVSAFEDGTFELSVRPGEYLIYPLRRRDDPVLRWFDEDYIRAHAGGAQRVTLRAGERKDVAVIMPAGK